MPKNYLDKNSVLFHVSNIGSVFIIKNSVKKIRQKGKRLKLPRTSIRTDALNQCMF